MLAAFGGMWQHQSVNAPSHSHRQPLDFYCCLLCRAEFPWHLICLLPTWADKAAIVVPFVAIVGPLSLKFVAICNLGRCRAPLAPFNALQSDATHLSLIWRGKSLASFHAPCRTQHAPFRVSLKTHPPRNCLAPIVLNARRAFTNCFTDAAAS